MKKRNMMVLMLLSGYLVGAWEGYIALWRQGQPEPIQVFPYSVASLPPADQRALAEGIRPESELALIQLLEDYLS